MNFEQIIQNYLNSNSSVDNSDKFISLNFSNIINKKMRQIIKDEDDDDDDIVQEDIEDEDEEDEEDENEEDEEDENEEDEEDEDEENEEEKKGYEETIELLNKLCPNYNGIFGIERTEGPFKKDLETKVPFRDVLIRQDLKTDTRSKREWYDEQHISSRILPALHSRKCLKVVEKFGMIKISADYKKEKITIDDLLFATRGLMFGWKSKIVEYKIEEYSESCLCLLVKINN
jgi:hypothetical protein